MVSGASDPGPYCFVLLKDDAPELALVHAWLHTWTGIGLVAGRISEQDLCDRWGRGPTSPKAAAGP
jgi:hypothetical protein